MREFSKHLSPADRPHPGLKNIMSVFRNGNQRFSTTLDVLLNNLSNTGRGRKQAVAIAVDTIIVIASLWAAYSLRLGESFTDFQSSWYLFAVIPVVTVVIFSGFGIYRWVVRSTNNRLVRQLIKGCLVSALALVLLIFLFPPEIANPRSVFVIYGSLLLIGTVGVRVVWQSLFQESLRGEPIAIYGAGRGGCQLMSMLAENDQFRPVVFIDDDPRFYNSTLFGLPVLGGAIEELKPVLKRYDVNRIILAMPSLGGVEYQRVVNHVNQLNLPVQTMPATDEIISGLARADEIRDISINDILGRPEVPPNRELLAAKVKGRCVLVTGGGGSIGSELCRQIMLLSPKKLVILDNCEANLYHITEELSKLRINSTDEELSDFLPVLGTVTDIQQLSHLISDQQVDTIYHAAAYKHVPIVEAQPDQGVRTNVFGTLNLLNAALENHVSDFVLISTDKAVRPTNAMGATKRVAEMILQAHAKLNPAMRISMVRFGNVLGSSGSVMPKFKQQIQSGGPITLTHSDMTRYFMTITEAAQLVLQASAIAKGGDVFVLDMGEPVRIEELAITMVRLYGKKLARETGDTNDIDIVANGIRPGEKMYEELFITNDHVRTDVAKIFKAVESFLDWPELENRLEVLNAAVGDKEIAAIRKQLLALAFIEGEGSLGRGNLAPQSLPTENHQKVKSGAAV